MKEHDNLAFRLTAILGKLNQGERLNPQVLAQEFGVSERTVQRDINVRLAFLPMQKIAGHYSLEPRYLGRLTLKDLERFACLAGVQDMFPALSTDFLKDLLDSRMDSAWLVKGHQYEDHSGNEPLFKALEQAVLAHQSIGFEYTKTLGGQAQAPKLYEPVQPYKLVNHGGIWYLAATHDGRLKAFAVGKITRLLEHGQPFEPDAAVLQNLQDEDSIWLNTDKSEVVIKVAKEAAGYFQRRKLIGAQTIEKQLEDGGLIVSGKVAHPNQILPIVRYWLPHVRIISPEGLQQDMENELRAYVSAA